MSRSTSSVQRNLTLPEELERLEQSITLTLQEIDHNFSKAHRIVTTSIIPTVEQYAEQSREVWEGSKFWKQFFESSANVSLSGYEEQPPSETDPEGTFTEDTTNTTHTTEEESASYATPSSEHIDLHHDEGDPDLSSLTISPSHSTPRPMRQPKQEDSDMTPSSVNYPSPYHELDREVNSSIAPSLQVRSGDPVTPGKPSSRNITMTPSRTPFGAPPSSHAKPSTAKKTGKPADPVLHHMLDKTYRVQATPLTTSRKTPFKTANRGLSTPKSKSKPNHYLDDSPLSSPELEAPKLHSEIFSSPIKDEYDDDDNHTSSTLSKSRVPKLGVSVLTPAKLNAPDRKPGIWDSDDEDLDEAEDASALFGHSPPKTMQFHVPQSRLLKTPAKEASKRIVSDLLHTAGGGGEDITDEFADSPSVIRRSERYDDETF